MEKKKLIEIANLRQYFPVKKESLLQKEQLYVKANDGITITIHEGETYGLVGESGCGKSTLGRVLLQLYDQTRGDTVYFGRTVYEYQPKYYEKDLNDLAKLHEKAKHLESKINNEDPNHTSVDAYDDAMRHLYRLCGGLVFSDNYSEVSKLLLEEYKAGCNVAQLEKKNASAEELKAAEAKHDAILKSIEQMKDSYRSNENFAKIDAMWEHGIELPRLTKEEMRILREDLQIIFQDPYSSLNPRMTVEDIIGEPLDVHKLYANKKERREKILNLMELVGLNAEHAMRYAHEFSGGQRQRIGIARALAAEPEFIVCDEPVSALDVSIQAQILNMLVELQKELGLSLLFISHDIGVVRFISDRIGVMYLGTLMEETETEELFEHPLHPYTEALFEAVPDPYIKRTELKGLSGEQPVRTEDFKGCAFYTRCPYATDCCKAERPELIEVKPGHKVACHRYNND